MIKKLAAIGLFLTIGTTLSIHLLFDVPDSFDERLLLYKDSWYIFSKWVTVIHCLLVFMGMVVICSELKKHHEASYTLGIIGYAGFSFFEIYRQLSVLFYLNPLREHYIYAETLEEKFFLERQIDLFPQASSGVFATFILFFALGNVFTGLLFLKEKAKLDTIIGIGLLIWAFTGILVLLNQHLNIEIINSCLHVFNYTFQPAARLLLGIWLWERVTKNESFSTQVYSFK